MTNRDPRGGDALDREFDEALALAKDQDQDQDQVSQGPAPQGRTAQDSASQDPAQRPGRSPGAPGASGAPGPRRPDRHRPATPWSDARAIAARAPRKSRPSPTTLNGTPVARPLPEALGHVLAAPLTALTDLPSFDTSAMDGWALAGPGPWRLPAADQSVLAGHAEADPLPDGHAIRIATGARVPPGATAVLRTEHGAATGGWLYAAPAHPVSPGQDIRPRGQECRSGDLLLPAGAVVTPVILGLAAAAGYDELPTVPRPRVEILVLGDELLRQGLPHDGRIRDALGPMLAPWLRALGAEPLATRRLADDAEALYAAVAESPADVVLTTGGTAAGPVDHVHPTLRRLDAELLVDGVAVRPGHPMLLARLAPHKHLVGLPGNPLAAVSGLLTLAEPLLRTLAGRPAPAPCPAPLAAAVHGHPRDTRLVPVVFREDEAFPLRFNGPAMLRGVAVADGLAVVPPGGAERGTEVEVLDLPWSTAWPGPQE
ncbi:molybdopterin molybdotransferase MoeA [Streptomyces sparsogenes]|uniref:molybdopterin molybdotransferase MoeA n=1 Tax=Streptomyces sparsogenes TaxID=67365 RepID=UPI00340271C5